MHCGNVETYINRAVAREYPVEKKFDFCGEILSTKFRTWLSTAYVGKWKLCV